MPTERDLPQRYDISSARYRELLYFVRQYDEKKALINSCYGVGAMNYSSMPSAHNNISPTEMAALRYEKEKEDVRLIEECVKEACKNDIGMYEYILQSVTHGTGYNYMPVPCGRNQFFKYKRKFFLLLDKRK